MALRCGRSIWTVLGIGLLAGGAQAQNAYPPGPASNLGGGFIELLMTGQSPGRRQGAPVETPYSYAAPVRGRAGYSGNNAPLPPEAYPPTQAGAQIALRDLHSPPFSQHAIATHLLQDDENTPDMPNGQPIPRHRRVAPVQAEVEARFERQDVAYNGPHGPGTVVIDTPNRFLYLVQPGGRAMRYGIGVGRPGFEWAGVKHISQKREWPDWRPPAQMLKRRPDLPAYMAGGPENPLGARALYLGSTLYRIHGTNEPETIGRAVSSGCIRMRNADVVDLYGRVKVGSKVIVI